MNDKKNELIAPKEQNRYGSLVEDKINNNSKDK